MPALIIDTAFETCQVGLVRDMNLVAFDRTVSGGQHDRVLAALTEKVLRDSSVEIADLKKIIVTTGPGRFTGLRVGIAFARGLCLVHATPLVGVWTTEAIAIDLDKAYPEQINKVVVVAVKRGESFVECRAKKTGIISVPDAEIASYVKGIDAALVGGVLSSVVRDILMQQGVPLAADVTEPSLDAIACLGLRTQPIGPVRPYYAA